MADLRTALKDRAQHLLRAWGAIFVALWAVNTAALLAVIAAESVLALADPDRRGALLWLPVWLSVTPLWTALAALGFSILAIPFLMLQRFIVGPKPPYLRPGYLAVMLYGPALLMLPNGYRYPGFWQMSAVYEAIALTATLFYVRLGKRFALFPPAP